MPDANILSVNTHLELMRAIGEVQDAPVIADLDTGDGNAVNVAYLVPRYATAGVAAVVIEDKTFPKDSSLRPGGRQILVAVEEFQGKVEAARLSGGPLVVARTEALIAGLGQDEALRRGAVYAEAGADAVLIHSKERTPDEILEFCHAWSGSVPLVLVPTAYPWRRRRPGKRVRRCRSSQSRQQAATSPELVERDAEQEGPEEPGRKADAGIRARSSPLGTAERQPRARPR